MNGAVNNLLSPRLIPVILILSFPLFTFAQTLENVTANPATKDTEQNDLFYFDGSVSFKVNEGVASNTRAVLSFEPKDMPGVLVFPYSVFGDQVNGAGEYSLNYKVSLPSALNVDFRARVDLTSDGSYPEANIRLATDRVFYLGNSLTQHGHYVSDVEEMAMEALSGTEFGSDLATGTQIYQPDGKAYDVGEVTGSWKTANGNLVEFQSYGWSGATARRYLSAAIWISKAQQFKATHVVVMLGINDGRHQTFNHTDPLKNIDDIVDDYDSTMTELINRIRILKMTPILVSPTAVDESKTFGSKNITGYNQVLEKLTERLQEVAARENARFVDMFHPFKQAMEEDPATRPSDGIHPPEEGHAAMAEILFNALDYGMPMGGE